MSYVITGATLPDGTGRDLFVANGRFVDKLCTVSENRFWFSLKSFCLLLLP